MAWKSLLTIVTRDEPPETAFAGLEAAIGLAQREDAHLSVLALGLDVSQMGYFYADTSMIVLQETLARAQEAAESLEATVRRRLEGAQIRWSVDRGLAQLGSIAPLVSQLARFSDLVVLPQPYGPGRNQTEEAVLEAALFDAGVPVLVLPDGMAEVATFDRVVIAWNQGAEALSAVRQALPILKRASHVDIVVVDPPPQGPERSDPGGGLSLWLSRHEVRAEVSVLARTMPRVSDVLMRHARDRDADLLVMGAYGHSRFREAILGGTTRNLLQGADLPVLMAR